MKKNPAAVALGRMGGAARTTAKTAANRAKMRAYWADVRAGHKPAPNHGRKQTKPVAAPPRTSAA